MTSRVKSGDKQGLINIAGFNHFASTCEIFQSMMCNDKFRGLFILRPADIADEQDVEFKKH